MDAARIQEAKYKTQSILGQITDTITVGIAKITHSDEGAALGVSIIKATRQNESVPKEKHVRLLVDTCLGAPPASTLDFVVLGLFKRLEENAKAWLVTLKTLIVFHRLMREADPTFQVEVLRHGDGTGRARFFCLETFVDQTTKETSDYSLWIRSYSAYLDERLATLRATRFDPAREEPAASSAAAAAAASAAGSAAAEEGESKLQAMSVAGLIEYVSNLQRLLGQMTSCVPEGAAQENEVTLLACSMVLLELFPVYNATNEAVRALVDRIFLMGKADAEKGAELVQAYKALTAKLGAFVGSISGVPALQGTVKLPTLEPLTDEVVQKVEEYAKSAPKEAPKPPSASPPSMADLLGFQSFIVRTPPPAADGAAVGGAPPAAAGAAAAPVAPAAPFDPFASSIAPEPPKPPVDPLDKVFGGALEALTLAVTQAQQEGLAAAAGDSPAAAAASPSAAVPATAAAAVDAAAEGSASVADRSPVLPPAGSTTSATAAPLAATVTATASVAADGIAEPYSLKPKDPLESISKELFGDRTPPPPKPMGKALSGTAKSEEASPAEPAEPAGEDKA